MSALSLHRSCLDVRLFLKLNITSFTNRSLTQYEIDLRTTYSILFATILIPNTFLISVICFKRSLRTHSNILVGSLCIANILFCFIYIIPIKIMAIRVPVHPFTNIYCQLALPVIWFAFICCLNFHICSISVKKFIAITAPFWYHQISIYKSFMFVIILFTCWIIPIFVAFLPLLPIGGVFAHTFVNFLK